MLTREASGLHLTASPDFHARLAPGSSYRRNDKNRNDQYGMPPPCKLRKTMPEPAFPSSIRPAFFCGLLAFVALFAYCSFDGFYFYDDATYARYAFRASQGNLLLNGDIFSHRLGIILPVALAYRLFGVNECTTLWFPVACTLGALWMVYRFLRTKDSAIVVWAIMLFGLDFYTLFFAAKLYPDVGLAFMALLAVLCLYSRNRSFYTVILFVSANFWGFLCKETIVYLLPFYLLVFLYDWRLRQNLRFWIGAFLLGGFILGSYFGFYHYFTGNALYRFQVIQEGHYVASYNYFHLPVSAMVPRLTYEPVLMFISSGMIVCLVGALPVLFKRRFWQWRHWNDELFWSRLAFSGLTMFWFFTTSFRYYNPNALFPRMILFLIPFLSIASAYGFSKVHKNPKYAAFHGFVFLAASVAAWFTVGVKMAVVYGLLAAVFFMWCLGSGFLKDTISAASPRPLTHGKWRAGLAFLKHTVLKPEKTVFLSILCILLIHPVYTMTKPTESGYWPEKYLVRKYLSDPTETVFVFTDNKLLHGHDYHYRFSVPKQVHYLPFEDLPAYEKTGAENPGLFVLVNDYSIAYFRLIGFPIPAFVQNPPAKWRLVEARGGVQLYEVK